MKVAGDVGLTYERLKETSTKAPSMSKDTILFRSQSRPLDNNFHSIGFTYNM